ncbi:MAG: OsmC family protein [Deltaproteobacteria bacterium]|nr:OsmC family protein [Deltaproteobacteria bacterium]
MNEVRVMLHWLGGVTFEAKSEESRAIVVAGAASLEAKAPPPPPPRPQAASSSAAAAAEAEEEEQEEQEEALASSSASSSSTSTSTTAQRPASASASGSTELDGDSVPLVPRPMRPMEMLLASLGSCGGVDLILILGKQRQTPSGLRVEIQGQRPDGVPAPFCALSIQVVARGAVDPDKLDRAAHLAFEKYCSVRSSLRTDLTVSVSTRVDREDTTHG